jgi:hypothetical protein
LISEGGRVPLRKEACEEGRKKGKGQSANGKKDDEGVKGGRGEAKMDGLEWPMVRRGGREEGSKDRDAGGNRDKREENSHSSHHLH